MSKIRKSGHYLASASGLAFLLIGAGAYAQSSTTTFTYDALGRLVVAETTGGQNNDEVSSYCFDSAGNRTVQQTSSTAQTASCVDIGNGPIGTPSPTPTPSNSPPVAQADYRTGQCSQRILVDVLANDSDPEGNTPLVLTAVVKTSGGGVLHGFAGSAVDVSFGPVIFDDTVFTYTVQDSLGAVSSGQLTLTVSSCGGGGLPP